MTPPAIRIIRPSSRGGEDLLKDRILDLENHGFKVLPILESPPSPWPFTAGSISDRKSNLVSALFETESNIIMCARGGYGASDLLPHLPWEELRHQSHKWIVGFSDISAIHSAFWTQLKWPGIHGPMPGSTLWGQSSQDDIQFLIELMLQRKDQSGSLEISPLSDHKIGTKTEGWMFGGCLSVLVNLIGTPYFPKSLAGAFLFLEEINESPGKIMRMWNQLVQSKSTRGLKGIIWGRITELGTHSEEDLKQELAKTNDVPVWSSNDFGHSSPNWSIIIGAQAQLDPFTSRLNWHYSIE